MSKYVGTENLEVMASAVNYNRFLISLIQEESRPGEFVVDYGAGIGTFARRLVDFGCNVHCIEPDAEQLARILASGLPAASELNSLPVDSVDFLYTLNVLEHIEDDVAALRTCYTRIRPGGRILIYVPGFQILYSSMDKYVGHFRRYNRANLAEKVRMAGFEVIQSEYVDCAGYIATLLFKVFGNDRGTINHGALIAFDRYIFPLSRLGDRVFHGLFGKNVLLTAKRPDAVESPS